MKEASGSTQAVTPPMVKQARVAGSGWESTAWSTSRTSVYLSKQRRQTSNPQPFQLAALPPGTWLHLLTLAGAPARGFCLPLPSASPGSRTETAAGETARSRQSSRDEAGTPPACRGRNSITASGCGLRPQHVPHPYLNPKKHHLSVSRLDCIRELQSLSLWLPGNPVMMLMVIYTCTHTHTHAHAISSI